MGYPILMVDDDPLALKAIRMFLSEHGFLVDSAACGEEALKIVSDSGDPSREAVSSSWKAGTIGFLEKGGSLDSLLETVRCWAQKYEGTVATLDPHSESLYKPDENGRDFVETVS